MSANGFRLWALTLLLCCGEFSLRAGEGGGVWKAGSREAREAVFGMVIVVDRKYGYVVVDLNTRTRAVQYLDGKEHRIDPKLVPGLELIVCRGKGNKLPVQFVARIRIRGIDDRFAVADLPNSPLEIQPGDLVFVAPPEEKKAE